MRHDKFFYPLSPAAAHIINSPRDLEWAETPQLRVALEIARDFSGGKANVARILINKELKRRKVSK
jgi:hypothetical protein